MVSRLLTLLAGVLLVSSSLPAQGLTSVSGVVTDMTGAVVPDTQVTLTNVSTQQKREVKTGTEGRYSFVQIQPGTYTVAAKAAGFAEKIVNEVRLLVNTPATLDVQLDQLTSSNTTVSVEADAIQINTQDATLGNSFGTKPILQLPFEGRNVVGILSLQPGVTFLGETTPGVTNDYRSGSVNGGRSDQANITLDGVDVNDQQTRQAFTSVLRVTLDSVQEFRVITTNANADLGRSSGAQVTLVTKSGTNTFHGSVYEYLRNKATNANSFFNNAAGVPLSKLNRNVYGASLGGPIVKNKLFFFFNYEGRKDRQESSALRVVPTESLRQGIVKYLRTDDSVATLTPDDLRTRIDPLRIGPNAAALRVLQSYPLPNSTETGDGINTSGFRFNAPIQLDWNTWLARFDYNLSDKHQLFARGQLQDDRRTSAAQYPGLSPNSINLDGTKGMAAGINSAITPSLVNTARYGLTRQAFTDTGVSTAPAVTFRSLDDPVGFIRPFVRKTPTHTIADDLTWTKGKHQIQTGAVFRFVRNQRLSFANSFPSAVTNASWLVGSGAELNTPLPDIKPTARVAYRDAAMAVLGVLSQGTARYNYDLQGNALPIGAPNARQFNANEYEFYLQDTWRATRALTLTYGLRYSLMPPVSEANGYQTSPTPRLSDWFDQRVALANAGLPQSQVSPVQYTLRDKGGRDLYDSQNKNFVPRFAIAYSPQGTSGLSKWLFGGPGKTSIRAGWGMYYDLVGSGLVTSYDSTALGLSTSLSNPSSTLTLSTAPRYSGLNTIPAGILPAAPPSGFPVTAPNAFAITNSLDDRLKAPYTMNMNFSIGRELGGGFFMQASYVGRLSRRSLLSEDIATPTNLKDPASGQTYFQAATALALAANANTPTAQVRPLPFFENFYSTLAGNGMTATQAAYDVFSSYAPDYTSALYDLDVVCDPACSKLGRYAFFNRQYSYLRVLRSVGKGSYHGGQLTLRKRFSNGDQVDFNYTLSKSIDLSSATESNPSITNFDLVGLITNPYSRQLFRAVSDYDVRHNFNANFVLGLPFGKGRRFLNEGGFANALFGGWQLSGLWRMSSGLPTSIGNGRFWPTNWNITGNATQIAPVQDGTNKNAGAPPGGTGGPNIFQDPAKAILAFDYTLPGQVGDRNNIRGDGFFNIDGSLAKRFALPYSESHSIQFRWEVFNLTNTARFDPYFISGSLGTAGSFGKYNGTLTPPRVMQFALRYEF